MDNEKLALGLQEVKDRSVRNEGRIKKLEGQTEALHSLATATAVMAEQMKTMSENMTRLTLEVESLKEKPVKRWEALVTTFITGIAAAILGYILANIGL